VSKEASKFNNYYLNGPYQNPVNPIKSNFCRKEVEKSFQFLNNVLIPIEIKLIED